jgi:hypothetical protein
MNGLGRVFVDSDRSRLAELPLGSGRSRRFHRRKGRRDFCLDAIEAALEAEFAFELFDGFEFEMRVLTFDNRRAIGMFEANVQALGFVFLARFDECLVVLIQLAHEVVDGGRIFGVLFRFEKMVNLSFVVAELFCEGGQSARVRRPRFGANREGTEQDRETTKKGGLNSFLLRRMSIRRRVLLRLA